MNVTTATIADVEKAWGDYKAEAAKNPNREKLDTKKLAIAVNALTLQKNVAKDLKQAFNHAHSKWATNVMKKAEGCTADNAEEKIKEYILESPAYKRHYRNEGTKGKVDEWFEVDFPDLVAEVLK